MPKTILTLLVAAALSSSLAAAPMPEGNNGIASKYPGDVGIEGDKRVLFVERFDERTVADALRHWNDVSNKDDMSLAADAAPGAADKQSLLMTHVGGRGEGGWLTYHLQGPLQVYARWYVKFDPKCAPISHFSPGIGIKNLKKPYDSGHAGLKPPGDTSAHANLEPMGKTWTWEFYSYWQEMRPCPPNGQFFGNGFTGGVDGKEVQLGKWTCVEIMMKMNDPLTAHNGELACWVDGRLFYKNGTPVSYLGPGFPTGTWRHDTFFPGASNTPFEGFQWRTSLDLNVWHIKTGVYITGAARGQVSKVWYDNIVVATSYIGPIAAKRGSSDAAGGSGSGKMTPPPGW